MIEEQALVLQLKGDQAIIEIHRKSACQSCELSGGCGTGSLGRLLGHRPRSFAIPNKDKLKIGDTVIIGMPEKSFIVAGLLMYLLPLISLFVCGILANSLFGAIEWINVVASFGGLTAGLLLTRRLSKNTFSDNMKPRFVRLQSPIISGELKSTFTVN